MKIYALCFNQLIVVHLMLISHAAYMSILYPQLLYPFLVSHLTSLLPFFYYEYHSGSREKHYIAISTTILTMV
jgi:hypothetical protein